MSVALSLPSSPQAPDPPRTGSPGSCWCLPFRPSLPVESRAVPYSPGLLSRPSVRLLLLRRGGFFQIYLLVLLLFTGQKRRPPLLTPIKQWCPFFLIVPAACSTFPPQALLPPATRFLIFSSVPFLVSCTIKPRFLVKKVGLSLASRLSYSPPYFLLPYPRPLHKKKGAGKKKVAPSSRNTAESNRDGIDLGRLRCCAGRRYWR